MNRDDELRQLVGMNEGEWRIMLRAERECGHPLPHDAASTLSMIRVFAIIGAFHCLPKRPLRRGPKPDSKPKSENKSARRKQKERAKSEAPSGTIFKMLWSSFSDDERTELLKQRPWERV